MNMECELPLEEQELGHFKLVRMLGEGGFGQVYQAWDSRLERKVAIKRLRPQLLSSRPENLLDEARMAASLRHPAFVRIFSIDGDAALQSIIMEFVEGRTLREVMAGSGVPEAQVGAIVRQVAEAMEEAHAAKLIHGDIKPSNLMLDESGAVRILDFGLARKMDPDATEAVAPEAVQGTIAYLAPELMMGTQPNPQSDIYALGVVMFELLTGARPFAHLSGLALAAAHIQSSSDLWVFPPHTPPALLALVRAMTARDPARRLATMRDVQTALSGGAPDRPTTAPAARQWRRPSWLTGGRAGMATAALLLVCGAAWLVADGRWVRPLTPFSTAAAMQAGMESLRGYDREDSINAAIDSFNAVLERQPDHAAAAAGLSLAYSLRHAGDRRDPTWLQRADAGAQLALKLNDQLALAYAAMAAVRNWQGKPDEALQLEERALRLDPLAWQALGTKAEILIHKRRFDEAERTIATGLAAYPKERVFTDALGTLHFSQAAYAKAEQAFRRSIALEPNSVVAYANLSLTLLRLDRADEALQVLQQGLQVRKSGRLYVNLGNALFNRGDYVGAAEAFEHAVSPALGGSGDYLNWANLGDALRWIPGRATDAQRSYKQAVALLRPLHEKAPGDTTQMSRLGLYLARVGERKDAADMSRRAVASAPASADARFRAAIAFEIIGDREAALAELASAVAAGYPANMISAEPDLVALRRDPRFHPPLLEGNK